MPLTLHSLVEASWVISCFSRPEAWKAKKSRVWTKWGLHSSSVVSQVVLSAPSHGQVRQKVGCQTVTEPEHILLFHCPSSSLLTSATETTRVCCKQHTCCPHSPSGPAPSLARLPKQNCRSVYNLGTQSPSYNMAVSVSGGKWSDCSKACCW